MPKVDWQFKVRVDSPISYSSKVLSANNRWVFKPMRQAEVVPDDPIKPSEPLAQNRNSNCRLQ